MYSFWRKYSDVLEKENGYEKKINSFAEMITIFVNISEKL